MELHQVVQHGALWGLRGGLRGSPRGLRASFRGVSVGSPGVSGGLRVRNEFGRLASVLNKCSEDVIRNTCVYTIKMVTLDANPGATAFHWAIVAPVEKAVVQPPFNILKREREWLITV